MTDTQTAPDTELRPQAAEAAFAAEVRAVLVPLLRFGADPMPLSEVDQDVIRIVAAARSYVAAGIEAHARRPKAERLREELRIRHQVTDQIAEAIEALICEPGPQCEDRFCRDCIRLAQVEDDAATARRVGYAHQPALEVAP